MGPTRPRQYLENIKADGYVTSLKYVDNLMAVIERYDLTKRDRNKALLPFSVIHAASQGDEAAICCILKRYEGYIRRLSTRCLYDTTGNLYHFVDEAVRGQLEIKLIESVLKFDIIRIA